MDHDRFDALTRSLSSGASRRRLLSSLTSGLLAVVATGHAGSDAAVAKKKGRAKRNTTGSANTVTAEDKLGIGERCDPPKERHGEKHNCKDCRTGFSVETTNDKGKRVRKCACKPVGQPSSSDDAWQCCSGQSDGSQCIDPSGTAVAVPPPPPGPPGPPGPPPPPPVCPAVCPVCQSCTPATGQCAVDTTQNGRVGTACATPNVCCTGVCCNGVPHGVRACNAVGGCAICAEVCPANCPFCFNLADGGTVCGENGGSTCRPCSSAADCIDPAFPYCMESFTDRATNVNRGPLCAIGTTCTQIDPCV